MGVSTERDGYLKIVGFCGGGVAFKDSFSKF